MPTSGPAASGPEETVAERLWLRLADLTPAERKVARVLLAEYSVRGLQPIANLAARRAPAAASADR